MWDLGHGIVEDSRKKERAEIVDRMIARGYTDEQIMEVCNVPADYVDEHRKALAVKEPQTV